ncbi:hypothetical protein [Bombella pollinis]|uniref:Uncharacterized protein n=1 Tax=Bombella pollinis TaxID=2967337 RepID=A0ABT3WLW6_9PROT|nr:hypothetical protein [Bombella pollinis]MCX5618824.1 hypothetical protein [Bombella pollinis]
MPKRDYAPALAVAALIAAVLCALLGGCAAQPTLRPLCPPLVAYTPQEQAALARELRTHPDLAEVPLFLTDYANERKELRAACPP